MTSLADVIVATEADLPGNPETARDALREAVLAPDAPAAASPTPSPAPAANESVVPEKFRGKTPQELIEMYQNLESVNGRMANDLGVQRQLTDRILDLKRNDDLKRNTPPAKEAPPVTANDILDRPQETLERVIEARTGRLAEDVNARLARMEASLAQQTFTQRHPDYGQVTQDPKFIDWVKGSALRMRAYQAAGQNWAVADELLSEFKTAAGGTRRTDPTPPAEAPAADLAGARRAALETSGNAGASDGKSGGGAKTYRRADLMRLRITDPEAYEDEGFQAEILKAYHEGRVK